MYVYCRSNRNLCKIATILRTRTKVLDASEVTSKHYQSCNKRKTLYKITSISGIFEALAIVPVSTNYIYPAQIKHQSTIQLLRSITTLHIAHCKPLGPLTSHVLSLVNSNLAYLFSSPLKLSANYHRRSITIAGKGFE